MQFFFGATALLVRILYYHFSFKIVKKYLRIYKFSKFDAGFNPYP